MATVAAVPVALSITILSRPRVRNHTFPEDSEKPSNSSPRLRSRTTQAFQSTSLLGRERPEKMERESSIDTAFAIGWGFFHIPPPRSMITII
jgi:hypothetical protein